MKKLLLIVIIGVGLTSCTKDEFELESNYQFEMTGRTTQDVNGYYHIAIDPTENQQSLHRFGAHVTNTDKFGLPTQVLWRCDAFWYTPDTLGHTYIEIGNVPTGESAWSWENFAVTGYEGMTVPIVNGTSHADPAVDSVFCMMAPIGAMIGDTIIIYGKAKFEEGDITLYDSINVIFK
jgi:hypothetical protein|tara:strand:- start:55 stop:588 length:534 start_codon:yes stop_codon:yes gene_type:complete